MGPLNQRVTAGPQQCSDSTREHCITILTLTLGTHPPCSSDSSPLSTDPHEFGEASAAAREAPTAQTLSLCIPRPNFSTSTRAADSRKGTILEESRARLRVVFFFFFFLILFIYLFFIATLFIYLFIYFWLCWVFGSCEGFL